ncbi:MAG: ROK family protein [Mariniphaga sp.]|nr:ROK family protein [Mariniphaga sp.]
MILITKEEAKRLSINNLKRYRLRKMILRYLYEERFVSAAEVSQKISVSLPTTKTLLDELIALGTVMTSGIGDSRGGRKPALYSIVSGAFYVITIGIEHYSAKVAIFDSHNELVTEVRTVQTNLNHPDLAEKLHTVSMELIHEARIDDSKIVAVGVYMPGLVNSAIGINYAIKNEAYQNIGKTLKKRFGKTIYIDNDARMQALGEFIFGKAKDSRNALVINWSWGLGLGMILNGQLYGGSTGFAGEFGHIKLEENGILCYCGKRGCLETIASSQSIVNMTISGIENGTISQLTTRFKENLSSLQPEDVVNAARAGDEFSISILNKVGNSFGKGLAVLIQLLNPEIIVLGGPISKAQQFILTPIQQTLNQDCLEKISSIVRIEISEIDDHSGLLGLCARLFQKVLGDVTELK